MTYWKMIEDHPAVRWGVLPAELSRMARGQVYLATPYTRRAAPGGVFDMAQAEAVARDAEMILRQLALEGISAVSPAVQGHAIVRDTRAWRGAHAAAKLALDAGFWSAWCARFLEASISVYVPAISGWRESAGIQHEVTDFLARPRPVYFGGWA